MIKTLYSEGHYSVDAYIEQGDMMLTVWWSGEDDSFIVAESECYNANKDGFRHAIADLSNDIILNNSRHAAALFGLTEIVIEHL